jgi:hypothetical protein
MTARAMSDWSVIVSFAQTAIGITSVGLNAMFIVSPKTT